MTIRVFGHYCLEGRIRLFGAEAALLGAALLLAARAPVAAARPLVLPELLAAGLAFPAALYLNDLYDLGAVARDREGTRLLRALGMATITVAVVAWLRASAHARPLAAGSPASALVGAVGLAAVAVVVNRAVSSRLARRPRRLLVLGTGPRARSLARALEQEPENGVQIVGFVGEPAVAIPRGLLEPAEGRVAEWVARRHADAVVVASEDRRGLPVDELLECRVGGTEVFEALQLAERSLRRIPLDLLRPADLIFTDDWRRSPARWLIKRAFDLAAASLLLLLGAPVMLATALLVRLSSPGPIFFRQERLGLSGRPYRLIKFRTMRADAEAASGPVWAREHDPRVTGIGALLRKSRLDELPQIFNVIEGSMSLVGPRPERPFFVERLRERIPFFDLRLAVKPGVTGWAQLRYPYGASEEDARAKLEFDLYYLKNGSLFLDLVIAFHTAKHVLFGRGAR